MTSSYINLTYNYYYKLYFEEFAAITVISMITVITIITMITVLFFAYPSLTFSPHSFFSSFNAVRIYSIKSVSKHIILKHYDNSIRPYNPSDFYKTKEISI